MDEQWRAHSGANDGGEELTDRNRLAHVVSEPKLIQQFIDNHESGTGILPRWPLLDDWHCRLVDKVELGGPIPADRIEDRAVSSDGRSSEHSGAATIGPLMSPIDQVIGNICGRVFHNRLAVSADLEV